MMYVYLLVVGLFVIDFWCFFCVGEVFLCFVF